MWYSPKPWMPSIVVVLLKTIRETLIASGYRTRPPHRPLLLRPQQFGNVAIDDPVFGPLEWDAELHWLSGFGEIAAEGGARFIKLTIQCDGDHPSAPTQAVRDAWNRFTARESEYRLWGAKDMIEGGHPWARRIDGEEFALLLACEQVEINQSGGMEIWYDDAEMYYDHNIIVHVNEQGEPESTSLCG